MRPRRLEGWGDEDLPETVQHQKNLQYLSANVRNSQRCDEWEQRLKGKTKRLKGMVTTNFRLLTALSLLLIIAGDVELNPGPIGDGKRASNCICIEVTRL